MQMSEVDPELARRTSEMLESTTSHAVRRLSEIYDFSLEEAMAKLALDSVPKRRKISNTKGIQLPWCGYVSEEHCIGVRFSKGLFTQCNTKVGKFGEKCRACMGGGKRNVCCGDIRERGKEGWTDCRGRHPIRYCEYMKKNSIVRQDAEDAAAACGLTIPAEEFTEKRPARRGRPPKQKLVISESGATDMLDALVQSAQNLSIQEDEDDGVVAPKEETREEKVQRLFGSDSDDDDEIFGADTESDDETVLTETIKIAGEEYLFNPTTNTAYTLDTQMKIGVTTPDRKKWIMVWKSGLIA
jgi:hypothetical protein